MYSPLLSCPTLIFFPSLSCPSPSLLSFSFILSLSPPILEAIFFFQLHLAFSALLCPTQGESTSFQTQPYFSNTSWSSESPVRPHTLRRLLLCVCVCVPALCMRCMCTFYNVSRLTGHAVSSRKHPRELFRIVSISFLSFPFRSGHSYR